MAIKSEQLGLHNSGSTEESTLTKPILDKLMQLGATDTVFLDLGNRTGLKCQISGGNASILRGAPYITMQGNKSSNINPSICIVASDESSNTQYFDFPTYLGNGQARRVGIYARGLPNATTGEDLNGVYIVGENLNRNMEMDYRAVGWPNEFKLAGKSLTKFHGIVLHGATYAGSSLLQGGGIQFPYDTKMPGTISGAIKLMPATYIVDADGKVVVEQGKIVTEKSALSATDISTLQQLIKISANLQSISTTMTSTRLSNLKNVADKLSTSDINQLDKLATTMTDSRLTAFNDGIGLLQQVTTNGNLARVAAIGKEKYIMTSDSVPGVEVVASAPSTQRNGVMYIVDDGAASNAISADMDNPIIKAADSDITPAEADAPMSDAVMSQDTPLDLGLDTDSATLSTDLIVARKRATGGDLDLSGTTPTDPLNLGE